MTYYGAPEMFNIYSKGSKLSTASDIYSLGTYHLVYIPHKQNVIILFLYIMCFILHCLKGIVAYVLLEGDTPPDLVKVQAQPLEGESQEIDITLNGHEGACKNFVDACLKYKPEDRPHINDLVHHPFLQTSDTGEAKTRFSQLVIDTLTQMSEKPKYSELTFFNPAQPGLDQ